MFAVLAVESICSHIERAARKNTSSLLKSVWPSVADAAAETKRREAAARAVLTELLDVDFEKAIRKANGVLTSTTNVTKTVLGSAFKDEPGTCASFFKGDDATYELRHLIAHGRLEPLDPVDLDRLAAKLHSAQTVGIRLVFRLLKATVGFAPQSNSVDMVQSIGLMGMVLGNRGMYEGPTEMALLYR